MDSSLTLTSLVAMFGAMAVLAAVPSVSVLAVSARAATHGFRHGAFTALGIVAGDILFILLAIFGLVLLIEALGGMFYVVKYIGGAYLIWLGVMLWRSRNSDATREVDGGDSLWSSFMTGLLITLADQKAVLFYLGFFPAFLDLDALTAVDISAVLAVTVVAVGGVKLAYALAANRAGLAVGGRAGRLLNTAAAAVMLLAGGYLIIKA